MARGREEVHVDPRDLVAATTTYRLRVRSVDRSGNRSAWAYGPTFRVRLTQESDAALSYAGSWSTGSSAFDSGGRHRTTNRSGASVSYTFTGRSVAWVADRSPSLGKAKVYVDGVLRATVDLGSSSTAWRQVVYGRTWTSSGRHTIRIVCAGTSGRPRIDLDAFVVLR